MEVRDLRVEDLDSAASILVAKETPWARYGMSLEEARDTIETGLSQSARLMGALDEGRLAGLVWFQRNGTFYHAGYIRLLAVAEAYRTRGVGTLLMDAAEEEVFRHTGNLFLLVSEWNSRARLFYEKRGYRQVGALPDYVKRGHSELIYWKTVGRPMYRFDE